MKGLLKILTLTVLSGIVLGDCVPTLPGIPLPVSAAAPAAPPAPTAAQVG